MSRRSNRAGRAVTQPAGVPGVRIGSAELRAALEDSLGRRPGPRRRVARLERRPSTYSTSFAIEELMVRFEDGTSLPMLFKDLSQRAMLEAARRVKPAFLYDPLREIQTYRNILMPTRLGTATCYGVIEDRQSERYGLLLEKVPGLELYRVGDFAIWQQVARWLAAMHTRFAGEVALLTEKAPLLGYDADFYRLWINRARAFLDQPSQPNDVRRAVRWLDGRYDRVVEYLLSLPVTFIHGEFYASNVIVQERDEEPLRVGPIDWEMAAVGPGLMDLTALIAGGWAEEQKVALSTAYRSTLAPDNGWSSAPDVFFTTLDFCRLHTAVQWLGWFGRRRSFQAHAQDWMGEALYLAEKLEL